MGMKIYNQITQALQAEAIGAQLKIAKQKAEVEVQTHLKWI